MATDKQNAANSRNARKSTGPRTSTGKARSARNSFKHGLLAKPALLPDEDPREFREFTEEWIRYLDLVGPRESDLGERIVCLAWRLNRCARIEVGLFKADRAERDHKHYWGEAMQYRLDRALLAFAGDGSGVEITDEAAYAEALQEASVAVEAKRGEDALLGYAFSNAAANGDPFGKLGRYETSMLNRLRHLMAELEQLQTRRNGLEREEADQEGMSSGVAD